MSDEVVSVIIGGTKYTGWENVSITKSMDAICGAFDIGLVSSSVTRNIVPGLACKILIDDKPIINGYIDKRGRKKDENSKSMTLSGRDKTCDIVDGCFIKRSGVWKSTNLQAMCEEICKPFGINVTVDPKINATKTIKSITLQPTETAFALIERACRYQSFLPLSTNDGGLYLTTAQSTTADDTLQSGVNIKSISEDIDYANRFSEYIVKSQTSGGGDPWSGGNSTGGKVTQIKGTAFDDTLKNALGRYRPLVLMAEGKKGNTETRKRAAWEAIVRFSKSLSLSVDVKGWTQSSGKLWQHNTLVDMLDDDFGLDGTFLITSVTYKLDESNGHTTSMNICHKDAFLPDPEKTVEKIKGAKKNADPWAGK